jgi:hypothetical protein
MQEICSYGSVGEPVGDHRLYPEAWRMTKLERRMPKECRNPEFK